MQLHCQNKLKIGDTLCFMALLMVISEGNEI